MNRDVCEHFTPAGIPCVKCQTSPRLEKAMISLNILKTRSTPLEAFVVGMFWWGVTSWIGGILYLTWRLIGEGNG